MQLVGLCIALGLILYVAVEWFVPDDVPYVDQTVAGRRLELGDQPIGLPSSIEGSLAAARSAQEIAMKKRQTSLFTNSEVSVTTPASKRLGSDL